jgi:predicted anti-sigma-YlaC factor YlaD
MTRDSHEQARELVSLGRDLTNTQQDWLRVHLEQCAACRQFAEAASEIVRSVRSLPLAADTRLVRATQMRVRFHASRLREMRQREWLVGLACLGVGLSATFTVPFLWRFFAWMGEWAGVSTMVWQTSFLIFLIAPSLIVAATLLSRGTHWKSNDEWRGQ